MTEKSSKGRSKADGDAIVIKKYANRRLYNTATSSYVTLDFLAEMVKEGEDFVVYDAKSGEDITRSVLTQIIFEEESKGQNLLPVQFLRQLIKFYGDSLQSFVPSYLEMSMDSFTKNQDEMRDRMRDTFGAAPGFSMFEDSVRKNMELYEQAMKMFSPLGPAYTPQKSPAPTPSAKENDSDIDALKSQVEALQKKLDRLENDD
ncbi:polyhydroxyalkanoate synthesis repressor PhaR [Hyphococcus lacteus]|uniref:Polyhydroxyalkanoate synthesis repressor PhaR n=1 Tax=Hyphococcus lacteus TaxID=3143536 RepID=A0ABV3Z520_9PROT